MQNNENKKGLFIVFEGLEGCGKSTQAKQLATYLFDRHKYWSVVLTREPSDTSYSREARKLLKSGNNQKENAMLLTELFVKDRREHISKIINPALERGMIVISDGYKHGTLAYQQTQGIQIEKLVKMHEGMPVPDITFLIDIPAHVSIGRKESDQKKEYIESFEREWFLDELRMNYLELRKYLPGENIVLIDGVTKPDFVFIEIKAEVNKYLEHKRKDLFA